jgi:signal transduction histidine kinase
MIKFTISGKIILEVSSEKIGNDNSIKFSVNNSGIGISKDYQKEIFTPFERKRKNRVR